MNEQTSESTMEDRCTVYMKSLSELSNIDCIKSLTMGLARIKAACSPYFIGERESMAEDAFKCIRCYGELQNAGVSNDTEICRDAYEFLSEEVTKAYNKLCKM